jgi:hypothetical protein
MLKINGNVQLISKDGNKKDLIRFFFALSLLKHLMNTYCSYPHAQINKNKLVHFDVGLPNTIVKEHNELLSKVIELFL